MTPKIEKLIIRYVTNSATAEDLDILTEWIKDPVHKKQFENYVHTNYAIVYSVNDPSPKNALDRLLSQIRKEKSWRYRLRTQSIYRYATAAILVGILATAYVFKDNLFTTSVEDGGAPAIVNTHVIEPGTDKAILTLEDGSQIALEKGNAIQTPNASSNGEEIIYKNKDENLVELVFNYLTVPRGGQFFIELSDGTKVWLNSESQLKYPVNFMEGQIREVELVYGEAYFEVSPSTAHKGAKFRVLNPSQEVEVLGTAFNIKAYKDETNIYTTLVEGKVLVGPAERKQRLVPNQQLDFDLQTHTTTIKEVDVYNEVSWKDGIFTFEGMSLKEITKVLSRWYDINFVFEDKAVEENKFNGLLKRKLKINEILDIIKNYGKIKAYEINEKTIAIR
ncbi:FecR family protein [Aestuariivivens sediminis]|uniref:FecR family protein n=1 Tax=Aestuariivivens sediminis TaxID=2913557 RepID=UPI001F5665E9|nr:FecR family protein [Aestuariivivens sediminis]